MGRIEYDEKTGKPILIGDKAFQVNYMSSLGYLEKYFKGLQEGKIYAVRCNECGAKYYPPRSNCLSCGSEEMEFIEVSREARLITYAEINVKPQTFLDKQDYIVGVAEVDGVKIVGHVKAKFEELKPDILVRIFVEKDGNVYRVVFEPIK